MDKNLFKFHQFFGKHDWPNAKILAVACDDGMYGRLMQCECGAIATTRTNNALTYNSVSLMHDGWNNPSKNESKMKSVWLFKIPFKEYLLLMAKAKELMYDQS